MYDSAITSGCKRRSLHDLYNKPDRPSTKLTRYNERTIAKQPFNQHSLKDSQLLKAARDINKATDIRDLKEFRHWKVITGLQELKSLINGAINRLNGQTLQEFLSDSDSDSDSDMPAIPDSPKSMDNVPLDMDKAIYFPKAQGFQVSDQNVVEGKGVIATRHYTKGDIISLYEGEIVCRVFCKGSKDRFYAFTISEGGGGDFDIKQLDEDTYVAWSGVTVQASEPYPIELGRNGSTDVRYLNHSKNPNVGLMYYGYDPLPWEERENLQLNVIALRPIHPGEELTFDYEPDKPDHEIDFSISLIDKLTDNRRKTLHSEIQQLKQHHDKTPMEKVVHLPDKLDMHIDEIIQIIGDFRINHGLPPTIEDFLKQLSPNHRYILYLIFSREEPDLMGLKKLYIEKFSHNKKEKNQYYALQVNTCADLKKYMIKSIFNGECTWFSIDDLVRVINQNRRSWEPRLI